MSQNQEIIEAKLSAYIDGELDQEGRAEIEKHLEANPQHRRLLESLKATRDLLRWLPREPAPPELAETLNGQLERSVLLDYDGDSLRPSIFPRIFAMAAIIVLTAGLAAAVYFALPKSHRSAVPFAVAPGAQESRSEPASSPAGTSGNRTDLLHERASKVMAKGGLSDEMEAAKVGDIEPLAKAGPELKEFDHEVSQNSSAIVAAANSAEPAGEPSPESLSNSMVLLVRSDQPQRAELELRKVLNSQRVEWKPAELGEATDFASLAQRQNPANPVQQLQQVQSQQGSVAPSEVLSDRRERFNMEANPAPATQPGALAVARAAAAPVTQPAQQSAKQLAEAAYDRASNMPQNAAQTTNGAQTVQQQAIQQRGYADAAGNNLNYRNNGMYVARMSRSQAAALRQTLSREGAQTAQVRDLALLTEQVERNSNTTLAAVPAVNQPAATMPDLRRNLTDLEAGAQRQQVRSQSSNQVFTKRAAEQQSDQMREEPKDQRARGADSRPSGPAEHQAKLDKSATDDGTMGGGRSEQPARPQEPATQPATTQPSDEPVNVVIVVQSAEDESPPNAAATQPAPSEPAQTEPAR